MIVYKPRRKWLYISCDLNRISTHAFNIQCRYISISRKANFQMFLLPNVSAIKMWPAVLHRCSSFDVSAENVTNPVNKTFISLYHSYVITSLQAYGIADGLFVQMGPDKFGCLSRFLVEICCALVDRDHRSLRFKFLIRYTWSKRWFRDTEAILFIVSITCKHTRVLH